MRKVLVIFGFKFDRGKKIKGKFDKWIYEGYFDD